MKDKIKKALERLKDSARHPMQVGFGQDVFVGLWEVKDSVGNKPSSRLFNVFAAPRDLVMKDGADAFSELEVDFVVPSLREWGDFDGEMIPSSKGFVEDHDIEMELCKNYAGGWVLPPAGVLKMVLSHMPLRHTFKKEAVYWSSSLEIESGGKRSYGVYNGEVSSCNLFPPSGRVRPVRFTPVKD